MKSTTPKTRVKSVAITKESPGREAAALSAERKNRPERIQIPCRQGDLALATLRLDLLIWEAPSLNLWSSQSEGVTAACPWSGADLRLAHRLFADSRGSFLGGREDWQWSAGLYRSGLNPGHDREV